MWMKQWGSLWVSCDKVWGGCTWGLPQEKAVLNKFNMAGVMCAQCLCEQCTVCGVYVVCLVGSVCGPGTISTLCAAQYTWYVTCLE